MTSILKSLASFFTWFEILLAEVGGMLYCFTGIV